MQISVITLFPEMFTSLDYGVVGRALRRQLIEIHYFNPRDFTSNIHRTVDDRPYGGGPGMVMLFEPLHLAISTAKEKNPSAKTILLSPQGELATQSKIAQLATQTSLIFVAGRYEGIDERLIESDIDEELSVGDYIVSGGELPAMLLIDSITRLIPGVLGNEESYKEDSFGDGLLDHPHYTRPETIEGKAAPKVLQSGDHRAIRRWRLKQKLGKTWQRRPDLIKRRILSNEEQMLLDEYRKELSEGDTHD